MTRWIVLALLALVAGCGGPSRPLDVGYHGSADGFEKAKLAADAWNRTCGGTLVIVHEGDGDVQLREQAGLVDGAYGETFKSRETLGIVGPEEPYLIRFMSGGDALGVITHELGHALGIEEHTSDETIMNPAVSGGYYRNWHRDATPENERTLRDDLITPEQCERVR